MIRINLLPHREEARKARRQQFYVLGGLISVLATLIVFAGFTFISGYVDSQQETNNFLKTEIAKLDAQLDQIKRLKEQTQALLARKQIIENLQRDRGETVYLLSEMVTQVPEGVYLKTLKQDGLTVRIAWQEGDKIDLLVVHGGEKTAYRGVPVTVDGTNNKKATFPLTLPGGTYETFDLYGVYGGGGLDATDP